jgi:hypothetical protein
MSKATGRYLSLSPFRRLVADLMYFSLKVPCATVERRMELGRLVDARRACVPPPTWSGLFAKAYAVVAARNPLLRTSYLSFPWPRFYEHPDNVATINVARQFDGERIVLFAHLDSPESRSLGELDAVLRSHREDPPDSIPSYRRAILLSRVPWPFRRLLWRGLLNVSGPLRCRLFGTFALSSVGAFGAGLTHLPPILTSELHYGMLDPSGAVEMRLTFDHRVLDGATAAEALGELEGVLLGPILQECLSGVPFRHTG